MVCLTVWLYALCPEQAFIPGPVERRQASDSAGDAGEDFTNLMTPLWRQCHWDGLVRMRDRKPRYDRTVSHDAANRKCSVCCAGGDIQQTYFDPSTAVVLYQGFGTAECVSYSFRSFDVVSGCSPCSIANS